ncbi:MAG: hypothetical protein LBS51_05045 [Oscillospiraceae bacterium]|jgi:hypothetical protein|nr:hypothetical protein [Oscillospiraceae bacterium]
MAINMRKISIVITAFSLLAAVLGFMLRDAVLTAAFDPISGLAIPGERTTTLLIALTVAVAAAACVVGALVSAGYEKPRAAARYAEGGADGGATDCLSPGTAGMTAENAAPATISPFTLVALVAGGVVWLAGAAASLVASYPAAVAGSYSNMIFSALSALSALSVIYLARGAYVGRSGGFDRFLSVIPPLFFSYWLILLYMANASNPVVLMYGYECLAVASAAMCFYFLSGCLYGKAEPGKTVFCMIMTVFLCGAISADGFTLPERLMIGSALLIALANIAPFIRGLVQKTGKKERTA